MTNVTLTLWKTFTVLSLSVVYYLAAFYSQFAFKVALITSMYFLIMITLVRLDF